MAFPLTRRQREVLGFIKGFQEARGFGPSLRETCAALGLRSAGQLQRFLRSCAERGASRSIPARARSVEVLAPLSLPRAPCGAPLFFLPAPHRPSSGGLL